MKMKREEMIEKTGKMLEYITSNLGVAALMVSVQILPEGLKDIEIAEKLGMPAGGEHIYIAARKDAGRWILVGKEGQRLPDIPLEALSNVSVNELYNNLLRQWTYSRYMDEYEYGEGILLLPFSFTDGDHFATPSEISVFNVRPEYGGPYLRIEGQKIDNKEKYDFSTAIMTHKSLETLIKVLFDDAEEIL